MNQTPNEIQKFLQSSQGKNWGKNKTALLSILNSVEGKQLAALLQKNDDIALQNTARAAAKGDQQAIQRLIHQMKNNQESMELLSKLSSQLQK